MIKPQLRAARKKYEEAGKSARVFTSFWYMTRSKSWSKSFSVVDREGACTIERRRIKENLVRLMELIEVNQTFIQEYNEN